MPMEDITGVSASELVPTGADDLVSQFERGGPSNTSRMGGAVRL